MVVAAARSTAWVGLSGAGRRALSWSTIVAVSDVGVEVDGSLVGRRKRLLCDGLSECLATNLVRAWLLAADLRGAMRRIMPTGPQVWVTSGQPGDLLLQQAPGNFSLAILNISLGRRCARIRCDDYVI